MTASSPVRSPNEGGSQKRKRLKADRSLLKDREYDPDKHCGVWNDETGKPCTRSLTCKAHTVSLRRAVTGRSKTFDILLAEHRATKEPSNSKAAKINFQGTVNVTTDASTANQMTTISTNSTNSEVDAPRSPPVLSLPDTFPLPQVILTIFFDKIKKHLFEKIYPSCVEIRSYFCSLLITVKMLPHFAPRIFKTEFRPIFVMLRSFECLSF